VCVVGAQSLPDAMDAELGEALVQGAMPGWVQAFVRVNPITHLAKASRGLMHGTVEVGDVGWVFVWSVGLVAVFAPLTVRLYRAER
jgi:ABC-2 type transport system permease protein